MAGRNVAVPDGRGAKEAASAALVAGLCGFVMAAIDLFWARRFFRLTSLAWLGAALWIAGGSGLVLARRAPGRGLAIAGIAATAKGLLALRAAFAGAPLVTFGTLGFLWIGSGGLAVAGALGRGPSPNVSLRFLAGAALVVGLLAFFDGYARFSGSASALTRAIVVLRTLVWFVLGGIALASRRHEARTS